MQQRFEVKLTQTIPICSTAFKLLTPTNGISMSETRSHQISRQFDHPPSEVFAALITPSQLRGWWSVSRAIVIPQAGGIWCATWGDDEDTPDYISSATIKVFEPDRKLVLSDYQYVSPEGGLPFEADFKTTFEIQSHNDGSEMTITQTGFPADPSADDYYAGCETGWKQSLDALEQFLNASD